MGVEQRKNSHAQKTQDAMLLGGTAIKPVERHGMEAIRYFLHNPDTGEYFTRTPKSWFLITLFYCIYYTLLGCFWYGLLTLFLTTCSLERPKYIGAASIIGTNPGVGIRPLQPDIAVDSSLFRLKKDAKGERPSSDFETASNVDWAKRYEKYLARYDNVTDMQQCDGNKEIPEGDPACIFDKAVLGDCGNFPYGYELTGGMSQVEPCVLLKINRIFGWVPEPYEVEYLDEEEEMPENVKELVRADPQKLYLDCEGRKPADNEAIDGAIQYFPADQGIPYTYFPYTQAGRNYHNPVVAVKFTGIPAGRLIHVECKLWAKGMVHESKDRIGMVQFEVLLE